MILMRTRGLDKPETKEIKHLNKKWDQIRQKSENRSIFHFKSIRKQH